MIRILKAFLTRQTGGGPAQSAFWGVAMFLCIAAAIGFGAQFLGGGQGLTGVVRH